MDCKHKTSSMKPENTGVSECIDIDGGWYFSRKMVVVSWLPEVKCFMLTLPGSRLGAGCMLGVRMSRGTRSSRLIDCVDRVSL